MNLAVSLLEGCDHAGLTLVDGEKITSGASSDHVGARADAIQHELREGPCVAVAHLESRTVFVPDLARDERWPRWAKKVTDELQVSSLLSLLLFSHHGSSGALNLYATRGNEFTSDDFAVAETLAAHLSVAVADGLEIENRGRGMVSRTIIGQAEGILMERYGIGAEEAFAFLRRSSQDANRKLVQVAQDLVQTRELPGTTPLAGTAHH
ncbi:GAF and ANTAR domain-containing protein [Allobranchiibius sp. CTAmp26]|uniref:GAF and ANTAR domain-containing protein n=1 Tax=Allobranchiibius sp. CTAmp26 TaxID=2815214 RepID=UPI001AA1AA8E|nr:GAF and ANTAR domain-containing protein [Allobranchiibius sp. CTAmp26]MBO1755493.1 GAF and ANTAR domain-containing protein [Allobranchiibius sp. CTAmp26]